MTAHRLFAKHGLAAFEREQDIFEVAGVRSGDKNGIHLLAAAEFSGRAERERDAVCSRRILRFPQVAARNCGHAGVLGPLEPRHQAFGGVQAESQNAEPSPFFCFAILSHRRYMGCSLRR